MKNANKQIKENKNNQQGRKIRKSIIERIILAVGEAYSPDIVGYNDSIYF